MAWSKIYQKGDRFQVMYKGVTYDVRVHAVSPSGQTLTIVADDAMFPVRSSHLNCIDITVSHGGGYTNPIDGERVHILPEVSVAA